MAVAVLAAADDQSGDWLDRLPSRVIVGEGRPAGGEYGRNFREAVADIKELPPSERSAMSNRPHLTGRIDGHCTRCLAPAVPGKHECNVVTIAYCPVHGLHGERTDCFVCGGPVKQVSMVPVSPDASDLPAEQTERQ